MLYLGYHVSTADGVLHGIQEVIKNGGNCCQIFTGPPQSLHLGKPFNYTEEQYAEIRKTKFPIFIHAKYLLNFAKPLIPKNKIFLVRYTQDLDLSVKLGGKGVVLHFGTASNGLSIEESRENMVKSLVEVLEHCDKSAIPILETSSGEGNYLGRTIETMNLIFKKLPLKYQKRIKFCIDTCHIFVAGYDLRNGWKPYIKEFEKVIGKNKIAVVHINDSATPFDGKNDRHEVLGKGYIFNERLGGNPEVLKEILEWGSKTSTPLILETHRDFKQQITLMKSLIQKGGQIETGRFQSQRGSAEALFHGAKPSLIDQFRQLRDFHQALGNIHQFQVYQNLVNKLSKIKNLNKIKTLEGVGKGTLEKIQEFEKTGKIQVLEDMKKDKKLVALVKLQKVHGIGPKLAQKYVNQGIMEIKDLPKEKLTDGQKLGLKYFRDLQVRVPKADALKMLKYLEKVLKKKIYLLGGFRLGKQDGKDLDIVVLNGQHEDLKELDIKGSFESGKSSDTVLIKFPFYPFVVHVDFRYTDKEHLPFYELYFGSGENFSRKIREHAKKLGFSLNEKGLKKNGKMIEKGFKTEKDIFKFLGMEFVKPEDRI